MVGIIVLAAGGSSRLGTPKQLIPFGGGTLLAHAARTALATRATRVVVVLGANADACHAALVGLAVEIVVHAAWAEGQASSLRAGLAALRATGEAPDAAIIMLCDQPYVSSRLLASLTDRYIATRAPIVASQYDDGTIGPPVLFDRALFDQLHALRGDVGAKRVIEANGARCEIVPFPGGMIDIDTEAARRAIELTTPGAAAGA
jgi:molybdenum cofactor cytidylyltransferase